MTDLPIAEVEEMEGPSEVDLNRVKTLANRHVALIKEIEAAQAELDLKVNELRQIDEVDLPSLMTSIGMKDFSTTNGASIEIETTINASIPKDKVPQAHAWFEEKGHGDMIKRKITILFGRDDVKWAKKFLADCAKRAKPLNLEQKEWVEPMTLGAFVREQIKLAAAVGADPETYAPTALLGVFRKTFAKVTLPGGKVSKLNKKK